MADKEFLLYLQECFDRCKPIFIALGDEVRLAIITALARTALTGPPPDPSHPKGLSVKEITNTTRLSRPAISHHLKILKNAGLVDSVQTGTSNIYHLTFDPSIEMLYKLSAALYEIRKESEAAAPFAPAEKFIV
ncbi:metalloregulator ArsR/SmtB family transcription factor [Clostridium sp. AM58-1XD]|uniref:ArsR/SmtB family transcription factor n=1 Tax=Clostridium sp. AM58-1XD TaxID=2292307 RepID=UPI000E53EFCB|nr:metalloregulator ArsR/SmtB family transcription factor [Clostridium sp. AM58-1XD]RGY97361.1 ArsR family transcriptional regulator [Clostridium sp. AM58-1XD]